MRARHIFLLILSVCPALEAQSGLPHSPKLLLTAQRLRRLQRDRERQTVRWTDFEARVQSVPASPERGFELALYYAVTRDADSGTKAVDWALAHPCELRQVALVLDWAADQISDAQRKQLLGAACDAAQGAAGRRDALFLQIATGQSADELIEQTSKPLIAELQSGNWRNGAELYAAFEYLYVARFAEHADLRLDDPQFFLTLPSALLLSLKPDQIDHPDWRVHVAALALISLDPNLEGSQFLQGWALEDHQVLQTGEGVAYELLWADPYLPGVGFQNLDPWSYDSDGDLFARTDWTKDACWIHVSGPTAEQQNCPADWQQKSMSFGRLTLLPISGACNPIPKRKMDETVIFWKLKPGQAVYYMLGEAPSNGRADQAGIWKAPANAEGEVCTTLDTLKVPKARKSARE